MLKLSNSADQRIKNDSGIMKSNPIAGFLTMLLLVVYPLVNGIQTDGFRDMARFIPDNALLYFEQRHGLRVLKEFTKSPLGKKFEGLKFLKTGLKIGLTGSAIHDLEEMLSFYVLAKDNKLFHEVFGKRFAIALLSPEDIKQYDNFGDYFKENIIVVGKPEHSAGGLEFLSDNFVTFDQRYFVSSAQYGNHRIRRYQIYNDTLSIVNIEGSFIMSLNEKQLRHCIDTFDNELPALAKNTGFLAISNKFDKPDSFFYLSMNNARASVNQTVADLTFTGKELLLKELKTTVGFANFGYGIWKTKQTVHGRILVQYNSNQVNRVVKNQINVAPSKCTMLSLTTENPMAFYWSNTIKIKHLLLYLEKIRIEEPQIEKFCSNIESITGKSTSEMFSLLGEEMSLAVTHGPEDKFFPVPLGIVFLHVRNVPELTTILEKIIDEYDIQVSVKSYGPIHYTYWTPSPQDGLQPVYGFWGDLIFFGNSSSLLRMIVERNSKKSSLLDNVAIKALDPGFTKKNNSIIYFNNVALINVLQKVLDLAAMTLAIEDREKAIKVRTVIDEVINPLLEGAKMYDKSCTRSYFTPGMVIIDSITNITNTPI